MAKKFIHNCEVLFECPKTWDGLIRTESESIRLCPQCNRGVYLAEDVETLNLLTTAGHCVAFSPIEEDAGSGILGMFASPPTPSKIERDEEQGPKDRT